MDKIEKLQEERRLVSLLLGIVNKTEICVSKLRSGFVNEIDFKETKQATDQLHTELLQIDKQITDEMNGGPGRTKDKEN